MEGSERNSKEKEKKEKKKKKKIRKRSPSSSSEDEGRTKRLRSGHSRESGSRKGDKKEKREEKKSHKHSKRHSEKEKKSNDRKGKHSAADQSRQGFQELCSDDYFSKNNEFAMWLKEEKKLFFSDLSSDAARRLFSDFVKAWNDNDLDSQYYEGIARGPRSSHNWKISQ